MLEKVPSILLKRLGIGIGIVVGIGVGVASCSHVIERLYIDMGKGVDTLVYRASEVGCLGPGID